MAIPYSISLVKSMSGPLGSGPSGNASANLRKLSLSTRKQFLARVVVKGTHCFQLSSLQY